MAGLVPAIPVRKSAALHPIGITGTSPVMTAENVRAEGRKPKRERESQPGTVIPEKPGIHNRGGAPVGTVNGSGFPPARE
jgi:hypothetical protein